MGDMSSYYHKHPERLLDQRGNEAQQVSFDGLKKIFEVLDGFEIRKKDDPPRVQT